MYKMKKKIAIIGASHFQAPLIRKAKEKQIETHVFAWEVGDVGEEIADYFYPISIIEKEEILIKCVEIGIDGICSIASELAIITVNYVANKMGLIGNSESCTLLSTNKFYMRQAFYENNDPSPKSNLVTDIADLDKCELTYPVIVKPIDRSGSRGITKVDKKEQLLSAINDAVSQGFEKKAIIEEFVTGQEYSVEYISWKGNHNFVALTKKYTTGSPSFIETGHIEPAEIDEVMLSRIKDVVEHALDTLQIKNGASHSELKVSKDGKITIIEIGGRMGGDFIGSDLVQLATGFDFLSAVIDISLGERPDIIPCEEHHAAGVRFIFNDRDLESLNRVLREHPEYVVSYDYDTDLAEEVTDSSNRHGYFIISSNRLDNIINYIENVK